MSELTQHLLRFVARVGRLVELRERLELGLGARLVAGLEQSLREMQPNIVIGWRYPDRRLEQSEPTRGVAALNEDPAKRILDRGTGRCEDVALLGIFPGPGVTQLVQHPRDVVEEKRIVGVDRERGLLLPNGCGGVFFLRMV